MSPDPRPEAEAQSPEPCSGALLELDVTTLVAYAHNPRRGANPEYTRIKDSIQAGGLDQPLVVTRRPGETHYTIHSGGATRLQALQELYAETGEARFARIACIYRPWARESDVLLAHLRENDLRGALSFFERALAVRAAKRLLDEEGDPGTATQAGLAEALRARGYAIGQGLVSKMDYAIDRLLPLLPQALEAGMGRLQIERIRQLERAAGALWRAYAVGTEAELEETFTALCRRYDGPDWDLQILRRALEEEIADRSERSLQAVSLALEEALTPRGSGTPAGPAADDGGRAPEGPAVQKAVPDRPPGPPPATEAPAPATTPAGDTAPAPSPETQPGPATGTAVEEAAPPAVTQEEPGMSEAQEGAAGADLKSLRARAWTLASRLAQRSGLGELIVPLPRRGTGFLLTDVPDPALVEQLDEAALAQISMIWWHLAAAAEMTVAPVEQLLAALPAETVLHRALAEQDAGLLFSSVWTLDPGHMGYRLWRRLDRRDWSDLVALMETYRALYAEAARTGESLWP